MEDFIIIKDAVVADRDYFNNRNITAIRLENSVNIIGKRAFAKCKNLTEINIPNSVKSIEKEAFWQCSKLISVTLPDSLTVISEGLFDFGAEVNGEGNSGYSATSLITVKLPKNLRIIEDRAFYHCTKLTSIEIPDTVKYIGAAAFAGCNLLTSITLPKSLDTIGESAFDWCKSLTSIVIPKGTKSKFEKLLPKHIKLLVEDIEKNSLIQLSEEVDDNQSEILSPANIEVVNIKAGTFMMGSPITEKDREDNETQHQVTLTKDFKMSKTAITNAQFCVFLNDNKIGSDGILASGNYPNKELIFESECAEYENNQWKPVDDYENHPVACVTWYGAMEFARWAGGALPTEAQWEYACRAGSTTPFNTGEYLSSEDANYGEYGTTNTVASYPANAWGLYDMHGNVVEWCSDKCDHPLSDYSSKSITDPVGKKSGKFRICRGGSCYQETSICRSANRWYALASEDDCFIGFRVVF